MRRAAVSIAVFAPIDKRSGGPAPPSSAYESLVPSYMNCNSRINLNANPSLLVCRRSGHERTASASGGG